VVLDLSTGERSERVTLSRAVFAERLRLMLYNLPAASHVPLVLHRAARGDWVPFARATSPTLTGLSPGFAMGMYHECLRDVVSDFVAKGSTRDLDVACVETLRRPPFVFELPPARAPR
jgi:hypothetical protein